MSTGDPLAVRSWWRRWRIALLLPLPALLVLALLFPVPSARLVAGMAPELACRCARRCALQGLVAFQRAVEVPADERAGQYDVARLCFERAMSLFMAAGAADEVSPWVSALVHVNQFRYAIIQRQLAPQRPTPWQQAWSPDLWWRPLATGREAMFLPRPAAAQED